MSECLCEEGSQTVLRVKVSVEEFIEPLQESKPVTEHRLRASTLKEATLKIYIAWPKLDKGKEIF